MTILSQVRRQVRSLKRRIAREHKLSALMAERERLQGDLTRLMRENGRATDEDASAASVDEDEHTRW
jgi:hypothetical protein